MSENTTKSYTVNKLTAPMIIDANWQKSQWQAAETGELTYYMGQKPEHFPKTQFKMLYDNNNIYVIFKVQDQYVRAVEQGFQAPVCKDSCVEFFFTPSEDINDGYFNVEINCGGAILLYHQKERGKEVKPVADEDLTQIEIAHSMPETVEPEITEPTVWTIEYKLPVCIFEKYSLVSKPDAGIKWLANFYKCGDRTSHPHWLTWNKVDKPKPDFHRPEFFSPILFK